jgi:hypothetical protein
MLGARGRCGTTTCRSVGRCIEQQSAALFRRRPVHGRCREAHKRAAGSPERLTHQATIDSLAALVLTAPQKMQLRCDGNHTNFQVERLFVIPRIPETG